MDLSLTCVVATELWHHIHMGGGLCDLPTWSQTPLHQATSSQGQRALIGSPGKL
jgi:hypothetical protein